MKKILFMMLAAMLLSIVAGLGLSSCQSCGKGEHVGPLPCNAQYVMGNPLQALWIDAVTGYVTDWCPAFPRAKSNIPPTQWP